MKEDYTCKALWTTDGGLAVWMHGKIGSKFQIINKVRGLIHPLRSSMIDLGNQVGCCFNVSKWLMGIASSGGSVALFRQNGGTYTHFNA